jgi:ABC-type branched-subunit amino acid transport system substrate-binding protein
MAEPIAKDLRNAAELALFNMKSDRVALQFYDSKGTFEGGREAARRAGADDADIIVGPLFKDEVDGARREASVPILSFTTDPSVLGPGVFSLGFSPAEQTAEIARYAASRGLARHALITPDSPSGQMVRRAFKSAAKGSIEKDESYSRDTIASVLRSAANWDEREKEHKDAAESADARFALLQARMESADYDGSDDAEMAELETLRAELKKKRTLSPPPFDSVFVFGDDMSDVVMLASTLLYYDVRPDQVKFLGTSQLDNEKAFAERALKGAWFPTAGADYGEKFAAAFEKYFGRRPAKMASLAYDAVALAANLPSPSSRDIENPNGFMGVGGVFRFRRDGTAEHSMRIMEISGGRQGARVASPAAQRFED